MPTRPAKGATTVLRSTAVFRAATRARAAAASASAVCRRTSAPTPSFDRRLCRVSSMAARRASTSAAARSARSSDASTSTSVLFASTVSPDAKLTLRTTPPRSIRRSTTFFACNSPIAVASGVTSRSSETTAATASAGSGKLLAKAMAPMICSVLTPARNATRTHAASAAAAQASRGRRPLFTTGRPSGSVFDFSSTRSSIAPTRKLGRKPSYRLVRRLKYALCLRGHQPERTSLRLLPNQIRGARPAPQAIAIPFLRPAPPSGL